MKEAVKKYAKPIALVVAAAVVAIAALTGIPVEQICGALQ